MAAGKVVRVFSDGAARGNPGPAGAGAVLIDASGRVLARLGRFLGRQTNNVAEYEGLLLGLKHARDLGYREVEVRADSQLLIRQLKGEYAVRHAGLKPLHAEALRLLHAFDRSIWSTCRARRMRSRTRCPTGPSTKRCAEKKLSRADEFWGR